MKKIIFAVIAAFMFVGCGISDAAKESVKVIESNSATYKKNLADEIKGFSESEVAKKYKQFSDRESLEKSFTEAQNIIVILDKDIKIMKDIVAKDDSDQQSVLESLIKTSNNYGFKIRDAIKKPMLRLSEIDMIIKSSGKMVEDAEVQLTKTNSLITESLLLISKAREKHISKKDDLTVKELVLKDFSAKSAIELEGMKKQSNLKENMDPLVFDAHKVAIVGLLSKANATVTEYNNKLKQLDVSYTKILTDMRVETYVTVGRVSWDENSDWDTEHEYSYSPVLYPEEKVEDLSSLPDTIATLGGWGGLSVKINSSTWAALRVNPKQGISSGDTDAEFYVEDIDEKFFHKYTVIINDKKTEQWEEVKEETFDKNVENLGMALITKPYGKYEEEKNTMATPPGLDFVGNPAYGEWKQDNSGNGFFYYYGMYSLFNDLSGNRYSRDYYNDYDRNYRGSRPYYSGGYGTNSEETRKKYSGSSMYKKTSSGKTFSSIRNAGSHSRARGSGGGGK